MAMNNADALEAIHEILQDGPWSPDTLEAIAEVMEAAGWHIDDCDEPPRPGPSADRT